MFAEYNKQEEKEQRALLIGSVTKRIVEAKNKRLECGCDSGGSYMYCDEEGQYIHIEDVIKLINTTD